MELKNHFENNLAFSLELKFKDLNSKPARLLKEALKYALLGQGKRIRPLKLFECAKLSAPKNWPESKIIKYAMPAALAVEYVHAYSLVHDDLPCMDDDDYRRGRLSLHRKYNEATAVLVGDALLSDAFYLISQAKINPAKQCQILSSYIGSQGMVLGQLDDLVNAQKTQETLEYKTGKLFECAYRLGAISVGDDKKLELKLAAKGAEFGLEFQILDNIKDGEVVKI